MNKLFVLGTATIFIGFGILFIIIPTEAFQFVTDGTVSSSSAVTDLRATYGGMSIGVGIILYILGAKQQTIRIGLVSVCFLMPGMAFGRLVGIATDGNTNISMFIYLALELTASFMGLVLLKISSE